MKGYVIGKFEDKANVKRLISDLKYDGHEITFDWTDEDSTDITGAERIRYLRRCAENDKNGVLSADFVIVLHHDQLCGGLFEMGLAAADPHRLILVVNGITYLDPVARRQPIFYWLPNIHHFESTHGARRFLLQSQKGEWE